MWVSTMIASCASWRAASGASCAATVEAASMTAAASRERQYMDSPGCAMGRTERYAIAGRGRRSGDAAAAGVHACAQPAAKPVAEFGRFGRVPVREIGAHARAQHAAVVEAQCARGVDGGPAQRLLGSQPEQRAGQLHALPQ